MTEYLSADQCAYLRDLVRGRLPADHWRKDAREHLALKLERLEAWAIREDEARDRILSGRLSRD